MGQQGLHLLWLIMIFFLFSSELHCEAIQVTGDASDSNVGLYILTNERTSAKPNNPVWKTPEGDRFIFNTGSREGWRIGPKKSLATGSSYCKSKHILILFSNTSIYSEYLCASIISRWINVLTNNFRGMEGYGMWKE